jgi:putative chitobiose transport system permease protein
MTATTVLKHTLRYGLLLLLTVAAIGPFLWLLSTALKSPGENIFAYPPQWLPEHPTLQNFVAAWNKVPMASFFFNSLVVTALTISANLFLSVLTAYPLARMDFKGRPVAMFIVLASMMIPFQVLMIPMYLICMKIHLTDAYGWLNGWLGLTVPFAMSGFGVFFVRQALVTLPKELEESAVLDGCNSLQTLWYVLLPLIRPTLATLAVFSFMTAWGEFLWPNIVLSDPNHFTLPVGLVRLQSAFSADWKLIAAGTLISILPIVIFFLALQRYFVSGATAGSVKG